MPPRAVLTNSTTTGATSHFLEEEHDRWRDLLAAQAPMTRRYIESQAATLADAVIKKTAQVRFTLPDQVLPTLGNVQHAVVPTQSREQLAGGVGIFDKSARDVRTALTQRLDELEQSDDTGLSIAAGMMRYAVAISLVRDRLPAGRTVRYTAAPGEEIPTIPEVTSDVASSAITEATDAIVESADASTANEVETVHVPFAEVARHFYLPQLVAFDTTVEPERLLAKSAAEAEANVTAMQNFLSILHAAVALAPYMTTDALYQTKRSGMLGQLVNQARAFARYQTREIIGAVKRRAAVGELNRGLSLSLPYFDDNDLEVRMRDFMVIPAGRVMFNDAFVVRAARMEAAKIAQDTRLSSSTRKHLLISMSLLEQAFLK